MSTTIASLLISLGVKVENAKAAQAELEGVTKSATDVEKEGGGGLRNFGAKAGKALAVVGAAAVAASLAIFKIVDSVTAANDEIIKGAKVAGIQADEYQRLAFAAKISGTNIKSIAIASKTVARGLNDAATKGTGPMVEGLELVGLKIEDVIDLPFEQQLGIFADAINNLSSESEKLAASQLLLGSRAGPQLATLLAEGSAGIRELGDEAARTGGVIGGPALETAANFQDSIVRLKTAVGGFVNDLATDAAPALQEMIDGFKEWTLANGALIAKDIKGFIRAVIPVLKTLASVVGTVVSGIKGFIDVMGGWKSAMGLAATATIAFKLALAGTLGPIGAIGLAIGALVSVVAGLVNQFDDVNQELSETEQRAGRLRKFRRGRKFATEEIGAKIFEARETRLERERLAESESISPEQRAIAASLIEGSQQNLDRLLAENDRLLAESKQAERVQVSASKTSREAGRSFVDRQRAGARVREKLGGSAKADELVRLVILGGITEEEALDPDKRKRKRGGGRRATSAAKEPESDVTLAESLLAIRTGTADPRQLKQVIQQLARKTPSTKSIKPTVAIDFFNFVITQNFKGGDPARVAKESALAIRGEFQKATARTGQTIPTGVVR